MNLKFIISFLFVLISVHILKAQDNDGEEDIYTLQEYVKKEEKKSSATRNPKFQEEKDGAWFTGGGLGLNFGTITLLQIAPTFGYIYKERLLIGIDVNTSYLNAKTINFSTYTYSTGLFTRVILHEYVFAQVEWELLNYEPIDYYNRVYPRRTVPSLFVGGGMRQAMSDKVSFNIALFYNLMQRGDTPYPNPLIRTGIIVVL